MADGSNNNIDMPDLGKVSKAFWLSYELQYWYTLKAGTPYSRSVQQANPLPKNLLPDAGLVFDT